MEAAGEVHALETPTRDTVVTALFVAEAPRLTAVAQLLTGDRSAAEDLVQDAFVALYRRWPWLRDKDAAASYLMAAVVKGSNHTLRQRYAARNAVRRMRLEPRPDALSPEAAALLGAQRDAVVASLARLPLRQRQVLVLRYYAGKNEQEIADMLAISRGSVKQHAARALAALTHVLEASS